ncbi:hypothetical protein [Fodinicurvata fenggangensis]|uniref:hypothetical protein n=1 Tax=Fodinicurvata fenggangensis TaxID=1121830 RepID=UPI00047EE711|nr:hypothetical protein [Fodinicurvata fenggangensis]
MPEAARTILKRFPTDTAEAAGLQLRLERPHNLLQCMAWPGQKDALAKAMEQVLPSLAWPEPGQLFPLEEGGSFFSTAPGSAMLLDVDAERAARLVADIPMETGSVFDQSDSRLLLDLQGSGVQEVLASGLIVNFAAWPDRCVAATMIEHIDVTVVRWHAEHFSLLVTRSYAQSLWDWAYETSANFLARQAG